MSSHQSVQEPRRRLRWLLVVVGLCLLVPLVAAEPPKGEMSAAERQAKLKERDQLEAETRKLRSAGKLPEAIAAAEKMMGIERQVFGDVHEEVAGSLKWLAELHEQQDDFAAAGKRLREVRDILTARYGKDDWRVTHARLALADVELRAKLDGEQRKQLAEADRLNGQMDGLYGKGRSREAIPLAERALTLRKQALGEKHPYYATSLNNLAALYQAMGDYAKAEPLYRQARDIRKQALGEKHPDYAASLNNLAALYYSMGDYAKAEPLYRQALGIHKQALGEKHPDYAASLNNLAVLYSSMGGYAKAEPLYRQALDLRKQAFGEKHPDYATSLNNLALLYNAMGDYAKAEPLYRQALDLRKQALGEKHPDYATSLNNLAALYKSMGDYAKAEPLYRQALDLRKQALGEKHPDYATSLNNLAALYKSMGDYAKAEPLYRQALDLRKQALGEKHPDYATSLNNLALLYDSMGDYAKAEPLYRQASAIYKQALGEKHPDYATSLNNLAELYQAMGDYAKAEPLYRQARDIRKQALGEKHPDYAASLNNLAALYYSMGDYAKAEPLYRQALDLRKQALGEKHPDYATSLNNLALLYNAMGDYAKAEPLYRQASAIYKQALGEKHPDYATSLNNLAELYQAMGDYAKAEPLYRQARDIRKQALGEKHPDYATSLNNLALLYNAMGDYAKAEPLYRQASAIYKQALGEKHPDYAASLNNLALLYDSMGDYAKAEPLYRQALDITRQSLQLTATVQSERQQLRMGDSLRFRLDSYLSSVVQAQAKAKLPDDTTLPALYGHVLAWKGAVFMQQRRQRLQRSHPELVATFAQLDGVAGRLAALALAIPDPKQQAAFHRQIEDLSKEKELLESDLALRSAAIRREKEAERLTPARLQATLPADAALVDFLEYRHSSPSAKEKGKRQIERRLAAFVVRRGSLERLDLGPAQPIAEAIALWRRTTKRTRPDMGKDDPAAELRRRLWQPLEPHLRGAKIVLVSPNGALARLPFAALPGSKPDSYLLEEVSLAVVPVPQLLPELLAADKAEVKAAPSLLLVGDVDFGAASGLADARGASRSAARGSRAGALKGFKRLEATREELLAVADSFRRGHRRQKPVVTELRDEEATEAEVRSQAPEHRYLHFATHGFFAPPELRSALAAPPIREDAPAAAALRGPDLFGRQGVSGFHPGLLSGLVLAGANRPAGAGTDDGILTALEVAELDLSGVELAALSACETGLGETAGGEGVLGLQRAFQSAGARAVVASLWQVDDDATRKLMVRFYENLWRTKEPLGKLAALREAQLWMLREGVKRGVVRLTAEESSAGSARTPPHFWAAFVLSGDWR